MQMLRHLPYLNVEYETEGERLFPAQSQSLTTLFWSYSNIIGVFVFIMFLLLYLSILLGKK
jgi:hypothetical protein